MKKYIFSLMAIILLLTGFTVLDVIPLEDSSILQKVADANGFSNWDNVEELKFTFNVDRDTTHFERTWIWKPKSNDIVAISAEGSMRYNWSEMDSTAYKTNAGFINDKYWLLAPYQLIWDSDNITYEHSLEAVSPIGKETMQKLTIVYGSHGGYTPGDAYDFYFGDDLVVQEWVFRKGNAPTPSMMTTFEDYKELNGLQLATMHKNLEGNFKLYFTDIEVQ